MKSKSKSLLYSLKVDGEILEYRVRNLWVRWIFDFLKFGTQITIPVNIISEVETKKAIWGHFVSITIAKYSIRKKTPKKTLKLKRLWVFNECVIQSLQRTRLS